ncbi:Uncharacterised protein [Mycobacteroides abscessus subsp. abscessus]|nr:Uncharacterised protein [Mycobacteroides abscessus subsp. abscessus]
MRLSTNRVDADSRAITTMMTPMPTASATGGTGRVISAISMPRGSSTSRDAVAIGFASTERTCRHSPLSGYCDATRW